MQRSRPVLRDGRTVGFGTVALVMLPFVWSVLGIAVRDGHHQPVSRDLGDHRRSGNGRAMLIAFDLGDDIAGASNVFSALVM